MRILNFCFSLHLRNVFRAIPPKLSIITRTVTPGLPVNFLEGSADDLDGERLEELVADVERGIEDQVPERYPY